MLDWHNSALSAPAILAATCIVYTVVLVIYRLYFSPIARFPGPKLAAITGLYEFWYDAIRGGKYLWEVEKMHEKYGPVVRIRPDEIHISDPDFYGVLYASGQERRDKVKKNARQFGAPDSVLAAVHHDLHRMRRATLSFFFSKSSVNRLEPVIQDQVDQLVDRMRGFRATRQPIPVFAMFTAFTNDVIMEYAFARSDRRLAHPDFDPIFMEAFSAAGDLGHWTLHMNWILQTLQALPEWMAKAIVPGLGKVIEFQNKIKEQIRDIQTGTNKSDENTIFHHVLASDMPESEKSLGRLWQEGMVAVGAGTETTAWTLVVGLTYIMMDHNIRQRLENELQEARANIGMLRLKDLEQLPYLSACIKESLRLSYGVTSRLPRVAPHQPLEVPGATDLRIPAGVHVSMNSVMIHRNPQLFPDPDAFHPERWLDNPRLSRYLVSFSKGARQCLGINLAYAELYMALGAIFDHFKTPDEGGPRLQLFGATVNDVAIAGDMFVPSVVSGNKHVKAIFE
ncbi:putative cytochrome P450 [Phaeosphaeriaceae sp. PMI808]|nr:putative cytochrome P450 [Phaeosphaeriaceae sp. PMI808]